MKFGDDATWHRVEQQPLIAPNSSHLTKNAESDYKLSHPAMSPHEQIALSVNHSLRRLSLILEILKELAGSADAKLPGDEDLRHGALKALGTIIERLKRIEPPPSPDRQTPPGMEEEVAVHRLIGDHHRTLLPSDLYRELSRLIMTLIPRSPESSDSNLEGCPDRARHRLLDPKLTTP